MSTTLTSRELATVLAALRRAQETKPERLQEYMPEFFVGRCTVLTEEEIDTLCERLNTTPDPTEETVPRQEIAALTAPDPTAKPLTNATKADLATRTIRTVGDLIGKLQFYNPALPVLRETEEFGPSGIEACYLIETQDPALPAFVFIGPDNRVEDDDEC